MHLPRRHLHHKKFSVAPSYGCIHVCISNKDFALDISRANIYVIYIKIRICIFLEDICIARNFHLHHHMVAFISAYSTRIFALDIPRANIYITCIHIRIYIYMKNICITRTKNFIRTFQGCIHICISSKDFASSIAEA